MCPAVEFIFDPAEDLVCFLSLRIYVSIDSFFLDYIYFLIILLLFKYSCLHLLPTTPPTPATPTSYP